MAQLDVHRLCPARIKLPTEPLILVSSVCWALELEKGIGAVLVPRSALALRVGL